MKRRKPLAPGKLRRNTPLKPAAAVTRGTAAVHRMRELYESGLTAGQVAEVVGLNQSTVCRKLVAAGVEMRGPGRTRDTTFDAEIAEKYQAGRSIQSLASEYHFNKAKVLTVLRDAGVETRKRGRPSGLVSGGVRRARKSSASTVIPKDVKDAVDGRDLWICQRCGRPIGSGRYSRHHRDPRGMGGSVLLHTMANLVLLCGDALLPGYCHSWVEQNRTEATRDGWLVPMGIRPEDWPVKRFGLEQYQQPGDEWVPAEPHPMQIEMGAAA